MLFFPDSNFASFNARYTSRKDFPYSIEHVKPDVFCWYICFSSCRVDSSNSALKRISSPAASTMVLCPKLMPDHILCNGTKQKSPETTSGLSLAPSRCTSLHNFRYGIFASTYCFFLH